MQEKILSKLKGVLPFLRKFRYPIIGSLVVAIFAFTVFQIDYLSAAKRDEEVYNELFVTVKQIKFDQGTINRILKLKDAGVEVKPSYPSNRNNPF